MNSKLKSAMKIVEQKGNCATVDCLYCPTKTFDDGSGCRLSLRLRPEEKIQWFENYIKENTIVKPEKIQMTEEQFDKFYQTCIMNIDYRNRDTIFKQAKIEGYIQKSELQTLVEEAKEIISKYNRSTSKIIETYKMDILEKTIQALKKDHPEFKK